MGGGLAAGSVSGDVFAAGGIGRSFVGGAGPVVAAAGSAATIRVAATGTSGAAAAGVADVADVSVLQRRIEAAVEVVVEEDRVHTEGGGSWVPLVTCFTLQPVCM